MQWTTKGTWQGSLSELRSCWAECRMCYTPQRARTITSSVLQTSGPGPCRNQKRRPIQQFSIPLSLCHAIPPPQLTPSDRKHPLFHLYANVSCTHEAPNVGSFLNVTTYVCVIGDASHFRRGISTLLVLWNKLQVLSLLKNETITMPVLKKMQYMNQEHNSPISQPWCWVLSERALSFVVWSILGNWKTGPNVM